MTRARVWGWGEDVELAGENAEKYLSKRWKDTTEECSIAIDCRNVDEGIMFGITVYMNRSKDVRKLVDDLLDVALTEGSKVYFVTVNLYDNVVSEKEAHRNDLPTVNEAYRKREQHLLQKFRDHPEVKALLDETKVLVIFSPITLLCELESERGNKVIVDIGNYDFEHVLIFLHHLVNGLIERGVATRLLGYDLWGDPEELTINDLYVEGKEVHLLLGPPAAK